MVAWLCDLCFEQVKIEICFQTMDWGFKKTLELYEKNLPLGLIVVFFFYVAEARRLIALMTAHLYASLSCARHPASGTLVWSLLAISWLHLRFGRPLPLFPGTIPSYICFSRLWCLLICPKNFIFWRTIVFCSQCSGMFPKWFRIDAFVLLAVHGILRIFL